MTTTVQTGQLVADRFRIVRFIAEGGMGEVYEAEDTELGDRIALKFLSRRVVGDQRVMRRFRREILLARRVTHPNVCRLFDLYRHRIDDGLLAGVEVAFVTMELLAGESLEDLLKRDGKMPEDRALGLIVQMGAALSAAHAAGIVHRDFKAGNVMLVPIEGQPEQVRVVVTDFGLARLLDEGGELTAESVTHEGGVMGTPHYIAPEQLRGGASSAATDVYALGVVIFEMVTGAKPYQADNAMSLLVQRVSEPPRAPRDVAPEVSAEWNEIILQCLSTAAEKRPPSVRDVVVALGGRPRGDAAEAAAAPVAESGVPPSMSAASWRVPLIGALVVVFATVMVAVWLTWRAPAGQRLGAFSPEQLTTGSGLELDPTFAPDGQALAYSAARDGRFTLFVRQLGAGGDDIRLTFDDGQAFEPAWSPDGTEIAFHDAERGGIWLLPAAGGTPRRVTGFGSRPAWSPDGTFLVFQSESRPALADTAAPALGRSRLFRVDLRGGEPTALTLSGHPAGGHGAPSISPDGRWVVFTSSQRGDSEIWSIGLDDQRIRPVVRDTSSGYDPTFASDGMNVYFSASARQVHGLWRVPFDPESGAAAGPAEQMANLGLASIRQLAIALDGSRIAYAALSTRSNLWELAVDPVTGLAAGEPRALTRGGGRNNRPAFSPDGSRMAFDHWRLGVNIDIWLMDVDGGDVRQVTTDEASSTNASWFPDGERLAFAIEGDDRTLFTLDLRTAAVSKLAELPSDADWARLSPDGTRIAYHSRGTETRFNVFVLDLPDQAYHQLTDATSFAGFPIWSPDGEWLAYQARVGESSHVMLMSASGGPSTQLTSGAGQSWASGFSPDGEKVLFAGRRDDRWDVFWVSRQSGETVRLTATGQLESYVRYPVWSPLGDSIVYEHAETVGDIWLVEGFLTGTSTP